MFQKKIRSKNYVKQREILHLINCQRVCLSWSFVLARCCLLTGVKNILMRNISNVYADRIWPAGRRFPTPDLTSNIVPAQSKDANCSLRKTRRKAKSFLSFYFFAENSKSNTKAWNQLEKSLIIMEISFSISFPSKPLAGAMFITNTFQLCS